MQIIQESKRIGTFSEETSTVEPRIQWSAYGSPFATDNLSTPRLRVSHPITGKLKKRFIRRLQGFFVQQEGEEAGVAFVEEGRLFHYFLPMRHLEKSGIMAENQPFEMDEVETTEEDGSLTVSYTFRPVAKASDAFLDTVELDPERKRKRALIQRRFSHAQA